MDVTTIRLTKAHKALLDQASEATGKGISEIIRVALDQYFSIPSTNPLDRELVKKIVRTSLQEAQKAEVKQ